MILSVIPSFVNILSYQEGQTFKFQLPNMGNKILNYEDLIISFSFERLARQRFCPFEDKILEILALLFRMLNGHADKITLAV